MKLKYFGHPFFPLSYFVLVVLVHKQADFEFNFINLENYENESESFRKINPFSLVPSLKRVDCAQEQNIFESWSIFEFLEENFPENPMLPLREPSRSQIRSYSHILSTELFEIAKALVLHKINRKMLSKKEVIDKEQNLDKFLSALNNKIIQILANVNECSLTAFDAVFFPTWLNLLFVIPKLSETYENLQSHFLKIQNNSTIQIVESMNEIKQLRKAFSVLQSANFNFV